MPKFSPRNICILVTQRISPEPAKDPKRKPSNAISRCDACSDQVELRVSQSNTDDIRKASPFQSMYAVINQKGCRVQGPGTFWLIGIDKWRYEYLDFGSRFPHRGRVDSFSIRPDFYILAFGRGGAVLQLMRREMIAYDTLVGEFSCSYAGFFGSGFGSLVDRRGGRGCTGSRSYEVPFVIETPDRRAFGVQRLIRSPNRCTARVSLVSASGIALSKHFQANPPVRYPLRGVRSGDAAPLRMLEVLAVCRSRHPRPIPLVHPAGPNAT